LYINSQFMTDLFIQTIPQKTLYINSTKKPLERGIAILSYAVVITGKNLVIHNKK